MTFLSLVFVLLTGCPTKTTDTSDTPVDTGPDINPWSNAAQDWATLVPPEGKTWSYRNPTTFQEYAAVIGAPMTIDEVAYTSFLIGDFTDTWSYRYALYLDFTTPWQIGYKELDYYDLYTEEPTTFYRFETPVAIALTDVENTPATVTGSAFGGPGGLIDVSVTSTLVDLDATTSVPIGDVPNCRQYHHEITIGGAEPVPLDVWLSPQYGMVRTTNFIGDVQWELASTGG